MFALQKATKHWRGLTHYNFVDYANLYLVARHRRLPPDMTMPMWLKLNISALENETRLSERSELVAAYLLPLFLDEPREWAALRWISIGPNDHTLEFGEYLQVWQDRAPEVHKPFIGKIRRLFDK